MNSFDIQATALLDAMLASVTPYATVAALIEDAERGAPSERDLVMAQHCFARLQAAVRVELERLCISNKLTPQALLNYRTLSRKNLLDLAYFLTQERGAFFQTVYRTMKDIRQEMVASFGVTPRRGDAVLEGVRRLLDALHRGLTLFVVGCLTAVKNAEASDVEYNQALATLRDHVLAAWNTQNMHIIAA